MATNTKQLGLAVASLGIGLLLYAVSASATVTSSGGGDRLITDWSKERVLVIGDSLGVGLGLILEDELIRKGVGAYHNISLGGSSINQWGRNGYKLNTLLRQNLESFKPTLVLISLGTNDEATRKYSLDPPMGPSYNVASSRKKYLASLKELLKNVDSVWLGPPEADPSKWPMDRNFRDMLKNAWGTRYFDTEKVNPGKSRDKVHFSTRGNKVWLTSIIRFLESGV